ncbi:hypothetical protein SAMN04488128_1021273 [Chitinophaga eiseniae]|uniref:YceI-like domain-containing protein n=1 Tax=Chitinophaga eiseniae TaxID=634771 RepID=A0A1T4RM10_9BACT|nr:hypothetical protein [Chitinophaga eiseniae]SKA16778.1 hypothetical protein SAMN04488128_1021273 [Chitinophaga eiseniae]
MKHLHVFFLFLAGCALLIACSKEMSHDGTGFPTCDYAPYTTGSSFSYIDVNLTQDTLAYTLTVSGDTTVNGNTYKMVGDDSVFFCSSCKDGIYTQIASIFTFQGYKADSLQLTYLKETAAMGSSWSDTVTISNGTLTTKAVLQHTIVQKGVTKTVNGKNYPDVIAVKLDASAIVLNNPVTIGTISTSYYAKGIGLIEADQADDTIKLVSYILKP